MPIFPPLEAEKKTVIIADDHELMLEGIRSLLERSGEFEILAVAKNGESALEEIASRTPDIAVIDASMPDIHGIEVISRAAKSSPDTAFIMISMFDHIHLIADAARAGASACVSKNDTASDLVSALHSVKEADFFVSRTLQDEWRKSLDAPEYVPLSNREREVMQAVVDGASNKEIATLLGISVRTVDHHRERMMRKIGAKNAADVVRYAAKKGEVT